LEKRTLLVTNAHVDTLRIKEAQTGLATYFDACISSHEFGHPKEHPRFWECLHARHPFDKHRTLFVDDSLPVLRAARDYGIAHIVAITHPDSSQAPRMCDEFSSIERIEHLK
jgi:HAD superfamily hydrolase (TIGR01509 family)